MEFGELEPAQCLAGFWLHHLWQTQSCRDGLLFVVSWCEGAFGQVSCGGLGGVILWCFCNVKSSCGQAVL